MTQHNLTRAISAGFSLTALAALLIACSSGDSGPSPASAFSGKVVDGYISGASVGVCGATAGATTNATGDFTLPIAAKSSALCATGGFDVATGTPLTGELRTPAGYTMITPLTTLVQAQIDLDKAAGKATAPADAASAVAGKLGLSVDLLTADPVATGGTLIQATAAVQTLLGYLGTSYSAAVTGLAKAIAGQTTPVDLTKVATLQTLATSAGFAALPASAAASVVTVASTPASSLANAMSALTALDVSLPKINGVAAAASSPASAGISTNPYIATVGATGVTSASLTLAGSGLVSTAVGFDITEVTPGTRKLSLIVDKVLTGKTDGFTFTGHVLAGSKLYASATNSTGTSVTVVQPQTNAASNNLTFNGNVLSVAWEGALSNALVAAGLGSTLNLSKGTYDVKVVINGVTLNGSNAATGLTIPAVTGAPSVAGSGVSFSLTVN